LKGKINVRDVWMLFRKDVTHILKVVNSKRSGIFKCDSPVNYAKTSSVTVQLANIFEPKWQDTYTSISYFKGTLMGETMHYDTRNMKSQKFKI
jgi:hypothetical protein